MRNDTFLKEFDFAYWLKLAKENPQEFERQRKATIESYLSSINDAETVQRLRGLQWRVDMERKRAGNPTDAAVRIYDMMWESVSKNLDAIQQLVDCLDDNKQKKISAKKKRPHFATILPFKTRVKEPVLEI